MLETIDNYGDIEKQELSATDIVLLKQKREKNRLMSFSSLFMIIQYILDQSHLNVRLGETEGDIKKLYEKIDLIKNENEKQNESVDQRFADCIKQTETN